MSICILIVEDDVEALHLIAGVLKRKLPNVSVITATGPQEAMKQLKKHPPDILITDVRMPNCMEGIILATSVRKMKPDTFIYFVTADRIDIHLKDNPQIQPKAVFPKPLNFALLLTALQDALSVLTQPKAAVCT